MENKSKRLQRPTKPKASVKSNTTLSEQESIIPEPSLVDIKEVATVPLPIQESSSVVDEPKEMTPQKTRTQTNKVIGVSISPARVRRHLDKLNINAALNEKISQLKATIASYTTAKEQLSTNMTKTWVTEESKQVEKLIPITNEEKTAAQKIITDVGPKLDELKARCDALACERTRFSNKASIVLAIICDELTQQLVTHTMNRVLVAKKKIIQISHLHELGIEKLPLYPLIKSLPSFINTSEKLSKEDLAESTLKSVSTAIVQAEKEFRKKYAVSLAKKKKVVEDVANGAAEPLQSSLQPNGTAAICLLAGTEIPINAADLAAEPEDEEMKDDSKTSFKFYVHQVCKELVKHDVQYKSVRISTNIKMYLSDLLVELIQRLSGLVLLTAASMNNKTVNDSAVLKTVEALLIDGHRASETIECVERLVPDPEFVKNEVSKKDLERAADHETEFAAAFAIHKVAAKATKAAAEKVTKKATEGKYAPDLLGAPQIKDYEVLKKVSYPTSGYENLHSLVTKKLALYKNDIHVNGIVHE